MYVDYKETWENNINNIAEEDKENKDEDRSTTSGFEMKFWQD